MFRRKLGGPVVFDAKGVDIVAIPPGGECVELHLVKDDPWTGSDEELASFQRKIQT